MKNDLFSIGPFTIHGYGLMIAIGILAAYFLAEYRAKKKDIDPDHVFNIVIFCAIFGILSAKILYWITRIKDIIANPKMILDLTDGFVVFGGIIGGIITAYVYCRIKKIEFFKHADLVLPSVALAQGFGRIGCFLAGCCYGMETDSAIGVVFHNSNFAPNEIKLLPTQLFSSGLDFLNAIALLIIAKKCKKDGMVTSCFLIFYSIGRFVLEFFRGDLIRGSVGELSTSQFIAIFMALFGVILMFVVNRKKSVKE